MAIEIPALAADRLPHPEWAPTAPLGRSVLPAGRLLAALAGAGAPAVVLESLRNVAAAGGSVDVLLAPDRGLVQILLDGRRIPLTGAARDSVLILLGEAAGGSAPERTPTASILPDAFAAARIAAVDAQVQAARADAGLPLTGEVEAAQPATSIVVAAPLMTGPDVEQASRSLARAVAGSGLFLEAHVAQWLRGEQSLAHVQEEARSLPPVDDAEYAAASESRAARQVDALEAQRLQLNVPAWPGQPMDLQIARDPERRSDAGSAEGETGLFQATLSLALPRLGTLRARIRLLHDTVGLQLAADQPLLLAPALQELATALSARGLTLAALELAPADTPPRDLPGSA